MNKSILRKTYLEKRLTLTQKEYVLRNKAIVENLFNMIDFSKIEFVHIFLPIKKFKEVNTWLIIERIKSEFPHIKIVIPKVVGDNIFHFVYEGKEQLKKSKWGIDEPAYGKDVLPVELDVVLVPLIVADKTGHRIGYGKGFYDRFLVQCKPSCKTIGLSMLPVLDNLSCVEEMDVPLHDIITP